MNEMLDNDWLQLLDEKTKDHFNAVCKKVQQAYKVHNGQIYPPIDSVFAAFNLTAPKDVKVVIIGQDPYHTEGYANGLCFSVNPSMSIPKSLKNIFKEVRDDTNKDIQLNGDLSEWAKQGVLLLNSLLTVEKGKPNSHAGMGWEEFTDAIISKISFQQNAIVFMLWGSKAQQKINFINRDKHLVLTAPHPSPLSVYRGFYGCKHFSKANEFLTANKKDGINW